jgi:hypothetical protein
MNKKTHGRSLVRPALLVILFLAAAVLVWTNLARRERILSYEVGLESGSRSRLEHGLDESSKWGRSIVWAQDAESLSELFDVIRSDPEIPELKRGSWPDQSEPMLEYLRQIQGDVAIGPDGIPGFTAPGSTSRQELWPVGVRYLITRRQQFTHDTESETGDSKSPVQPNKMPKLRKNGVAVEPSQLWTGWEPLRFGDRYFVFVNSWSWPRVLCISHDTVSRHLSLEGDDWETPDLAWLTYNLFNPNVPPGRATDFTIIRDEPGDILLDVTVLHPEFDGLLVLNEPWDDRWHATIDGSEVDISKLQGILMCVAVHPGKQTVEFKCSPG